MYQFCVCMDCFHVCFIYLFQFLFIDIFMWDWFVLTYVTGPWVYILSMHYIHVLGFKYDFGYCKHNVWISISLFL